MMYMSGASVQIFSIMSVWGCLKGAIGGILGVEKGAESRLVRHYLKHGLPPA